MSVAAETWKQIVAGTEATPRSKPLSRAPEWERFGSAQELSLVHQLFFPAVAVSRKSVLVAATDEQSNSSKLCENLAITLSKVSGQRVAVLECCSPAHKTPDVSVGPPSSAWQAYATRVSESVWRIPASFLCSERSRRDGLKNDYLNGLGSTFEYFLFSAAISDSEMPVLCGLCDAAILLLAANITRREAALRGKEQLLLHKVNLIGTVLDQRILPIPQSIYERL